MRSWIKGAAVGSFAVLLLAGASVRAEPTTLEELPAKARDGVGSVVGDHRIVGLSRQTHANCAVSYEVQFKTKTRGRVEAQLASDGTLLQTWQGVDQPSGSGP